MPDAPQRTGLLLQGTSLIWAMLVVLGGLIFVTGQTLADLRSSDQGQQDRITRLEGIATRLESVPYDIQLIKSRLGIKEK